MGDTDLSWSVWVLEEGRFGGVEVEKMCHFLNKNPKKQINRQEKQTVNGKWKASWRVNKQQSSMTCFPWEADTVISMGKAQISISRMWTQMRHDPHPKYAEIHIVFMPISYITPHIRQTLLHFIFQKEHHKDKIKPCTINTWETPGEVHPINSLGWEGIWGGLQVKLLHLAGSVLDESADDPAEGVPRPTPPRHFLS